MRTGGPSIGCADGQLGRAGEQRASWAFQFRSLVNFDPAAARVPEKSPTGVVGERKESQVRRTAIGSSDDDC